MKDKILFWMDAWLTHFGIAKFLQEKHDCELFAIIDINIAKKFFQNQQLVQFEKVWYYRDCLVKTMEKPDLKYLASFEERYKINLWNIAYSDVIFNRHNEYYKFNSDEILLILEQECKFFESILDEINPDYLIIRMTDFSQNQLLHQICKAREIKILTLGPTRVGYRGMISTDTDLMDNLGESHENYSNYEGKKIEELRDYIKGYSTQQKMFRKEYRTSILQWLMASLRFLVLVSGSHYRNYYGHYGITVSKVVIKQISFSLKKLCREFFMKRNLSSQVDKNTPFVYFPLHYDPERTTLIPAPFYTNQLEVIKNIAKSLPVDYKLYVKEHPMQVFFGWRNISYYKEIRDLPNVQLIHPSVSNDEMIRKCSLVVTIAGTSGLEAAFYEKPSIILADVIYSSLPSVYRLKNIEELPYAIRSSLQRKVNLTDLSKFVNLIDKNSFEFDEMELFRRIYDRFYYSGFLTDMYISISKMNAFLEENRSVFELLAIEHIKKINQHKKYSSEKYHDATADIQKAGSIGSTKVV